MQTAETERLISRLCCIKIKTDNACVLRNRTFAFCF